MNIDDKTVKLAKNPLGIIALFILLTYGMASFLFGFINNNISESQKWVFVIFITFFPFIVLFVFYRLVTKYHHKLYSPGEYKDEANFLGQTLSKEIGRNKEQEREKEIEDMNVMESKEEKKVLASGTSERSTSVSTQSRKKNIQNTEDDNKKTLNQYIRAEKLAINKLAKDRNARIYDDISTGGRDIGFDGLLEGDKELTLVEVKYFKRIIIPFNVVDSVASRARNALEIINNRIKTTKRIVVTLIIVIAPEVNDPNLDFLKEKLAEYNKLILNSPLDIVVYKLDDLENNS